VLECASGGTSPDWLPLKVSLAHVKLPLGAESRARPPSVGGLSAAGSIVGNLIGSACPVREAGVRYDEEGIVGFGGRPEEPAKRGRSGAPVGEAQDGGGAQQLRGEDWAGCRRGLRVTTRAHGPGRGIVRLKAMIGDLTMRNKLLREMARALEADLPLAQRRSKR
jgi:hypothetical protein